MTRTNALHEHRFFWGGGILTTTSCQRHIVKRCWWTAGPETDKRDTDMMTSWRANISPQKKYFESTFRHSNSTNLHSMIVCRPRAWSLKWSDTNNIFYSVFLPTQAETHNFATYGSPSFNTLILSFNIYNKASGLWCSEKGICVTNTAQLTLRPCCTIVNMKKKKKVSFQIRTLPRFNLSSQYVVVI